MRITNLGAILSELQACETAVDEIRRKFGNEPIVSKANLRRAYRYRGEAYFTFFIRIWLRWPDSLDDYVRDKAYEARKRHLRLFSPEAQALAEKVYVEAVYAYVEEMSKP